MECNSGRRMAGMPTKKFEPTPTQNRELLGQCIPARQAFDVAFLQRRPEGDFGGDYPGQNPMRRADDVLYGERVTEPIPFGDSLDHARQHDIGEFSAHDGQGGQGVTAVH